MTATPRPTPDGMVSTAVKLTSPRKAIASGIAYLPEERAANALFPMMTVAQNVTLPRLSKFIGLDGLINNPMESAAVSALLKRLDLRPLKGAAKAKIRTFSGGNQQKAIIARWLLGSADIFLFDEPTQGIDVHKPSGNFQDRFRCDCRHDAPPTAAVCVNERTRNYRSC
jgi:ABC-type sugar transport system ATPase subunit